MRKTFYSFVAVLFVAVLMMQTVSATGPKTYGQLLVDLGIIQGYNGDPFERGILFREELVTILVRLTSTKEDENFIPPKKPTFKDIPASHWAYSYVELAHHKGISKGVEKNRFGLGEAVTTNQVTLLLIRALGHNTDTIEFKNATQQIKDKYGLGLKHELSGNTTLYRGEAFELLAKTLQMNTKEGVRKIETLSYEPAKVEKFDQDFKTAVTDKGFRVYNRSVGEFKLKEFVVFPELEKLTFTANKENAKIFQDTEDQRKGMDNFVNNYLQTLGKELPVQKESIPYRDSILQYQDSEINVKIEKNTEKVSHNQTAVSIRIKQEGDRLEVEFSSEGSKGKKSTGGYINKVKQYPTLDGMSAYAVFGREKIKKAYKQLKNPIEVEEDFYVAFTTDNSGKVVEVMAKTSHGIGYYKSK